jgi:hypothetical protein
VRLEIVAALAMVSLVTGCGLGHAAGARTAAKWRVAADAWQANAAGWEKSFRDSERLRAGEATAARQALGDAAAACDIRVAEAREAARRVRALVNEPPKIDEKGCPVPRIITAAEIFGGRQ